MDTADTPITKRESVLPNAASKVIKIQIESASKMTHGEVTLVAVPHALARRKGLVIWLSCWGVAVLSLPIPIVHLIAPPVLLLFGPIAGIIAYKLYAGATDIVGGGGQCPDCGKAINLAGRDAHWPLDIICSGCQARLLAREEEAAR